MWRLILTLSPGWKFKILWVLEIFLAGHSVEIAIVYIDNSIWSYHASFFKNAPEKSLMVKICTI